MPKVIKPDKIKKVKRLLQTNLTKQEIANISGVSVGSIYNIEYGDKKIPGDKKKESDNTVLKQILEQLKIIAENIKPASGKKKVFFKFPG